MAKKSARDARGGEREKQLQRGRALRVVDVDQVLALEDERLAEAEIVMLAAQPVQNDWPAELEAKWATAAGRA